jgi:hypothetical protein
MEICGIESSTVDEAVPYTSEELKQTGPEMSDFTSPDFADSTEPLESLDAGEGVGLELSFVELSRTLAPSMMSCNGMVISAHLMSS